jgi:hypothetical protein
MQPWWLCLINEINDVRHKLNLCGISVTLINAMTDINEINVTLM